MQQMFAIELAALRVAGAGLGQRRTYRCRSGMLYANVASFMVPAGGKMGSLTQACSATMLTPDAVPSPGGCPRHSRHAGHKGVQAAGQALIQEAPSLAASHIRVQQQQQARRVATRRRLQILHAAGP